jgi:hypothetical protein
MIRKALVLLWLLFPVGVLAFHFNYGQSYMLREAASNDLKRIAELEQLPDDQRDWEQIIAEYEKLEEKLAATELSDMIDRIKLAKARACLEMLDIGTAIEDLTELLQACATRYGDDAPITRAVRETLGKAHYHAALLLQESDLPEKEWRPFADRSRQLFRYLAEHDDPAALKDYEERVTKEFDRAAKRITGTGN